MQMMSKNLSVFLLAIVGVLFLAATVSAAEIANIEQITIDGVDASEASIVAGDTVTVKVYFEALENVSDVRVEAEFETGTADSESRTSLFDVEDGYVYKKTLTLEVPYELDDQVSDTATLEIEIWNGDYKTEEEVEVRIQRESYDADIKSISVSNSIDAGDTFPVDIALTNSGYNDLDDLYVTVSIPALGIERTDYFGDLIAVECDEDYDDEENYGVDFDDTANRKCDEDDEDTLRGRIYLEVPYDVAEGVYTIQVEVSNDEMSVVETKQVSINNDFSAGSVFVDSTSKTANVGSSAEYMIYIANPSDTLKFYRVVTSSSSGLSTSVDSSVVGVPAGSSRTVTVTADASSAGDYDFSVDVLSGEELVETVALNLKAEGTSVGNPVVVLTIILAIVFLVLLVVLIVLLGKKPEKTEDFGESYY